MSLDTRLLNLEMSNEDERELGPLKYLAETTGQDMGQVVNWFLLLIVFVFDPLAIAMVIAANFAFSQIRKPEIDFDLDNPPPPNDKLKNTVEKYKEIKIEKEDVIMDNMENVTIPKIQEDIYTEKDEKRMNVIGQNGNDGIHYEFNDINKKLSEEEILGLDTVEFRGEGHIEQESIENEEKEVIVNKEGVKPISAKEAIRVKQQSKLKAQRLVYKSNR